MVIIVNNGGSQTVVGVFSISPSGVMVLWRVLVVLWGVLFILKVVAIGELCRLKAMVWEPDNLLSLFIIESCSETTIGVF
jgi:hypothetical protein